MPEPLPILQQFDEQLKVEEQLPKIREVREAIELLMYYIEHCDIDDHFVERTLAGIRRRVEALGVVRNKTP